MGGIRLCTRSCQAWSPSLLPHPYVHPRADLAFAHLPQLFSGTIYIYNMLEVKLHCIQIFLAIEKELDEKNKVTNTSMCQGRNAHTTTLP